MKPQITVGHGIFVGFWVFELQCSCLSTKTSSVTLLYPFLNGIKTFTQQDIFLSNITLVQLQHGGKQGGVVQEEEGGGGLVGESHKRETRLINLHTWSRT